LRGVHYKSPIASAQVKSAILLAGLFAKGKTTVDEPMASRNHTELMFNYFLIRTAKGEDNTVSVFGDQVPESRDFTIPGDISSAAFWLVAAAAQSGGHLLVRNIGLNDTRTAPLGVLVRMGAQVREAVEDVDQIEPRGVVEVTGVPLKGTVIHGKEIPQLIDELPVLAVLAARARGTTIVRDASELRVKESDRVATTCAMLRAFGIACEPRADGFAVEGRPDRPLAAAAVHSDGDHRIAMAAAVAALVADGPCQIDDADNVATSYPGFAAALTQLGAAIQAA
jgi:3-phosphoshikimate 1-carboxyvinyltransferase